MTTLDKVLEDVKRLAPEERRRLREVLNELSEIGDDAPDDAETQRREAEFERRLLEKGIITHIPPPIDDPLPYEKWTPIKIEGKPVSETIIEERR